MNKIYAYKNVMYPGLIKIGQTTGNVEERVKAQFPQQLMDNWVKPFVIIFSVIGMTNDGKEFTDKDIHKKLEQRGFRRAASNMEYFECQPSEVLEVVTEVMTGKILKGSNNVRGCGDFDNLLMTKFIDDCKNNSQQEVSYCKTELARILEEYITTKRVPKARALVRKFMHKYEYLDNINRLSGKLEPLGYSATLERGNTSELRLKIRGATL